MNYNHTKNKIKMIKFIQGVHPTFKQQFDKLIIAYIDNKVDAWDPCACFVGNLLNGTNGWIGGKCGRGTISDGGYWVNEAVKDINRNSNGLYSLQEILDLEKVFLDAIGPFKEGEPEYEQILFTAFEATLNSLKVLHQSKGEVIDETPVFTKRNLITT